MQKLGEFVKCGERLLAAELQVGSCASLAGKEPAKRQERRGFK